MSLTLWLEAIKQTSADYQALKQVETESSLPDECLLTLGAVALAAQCILQQHRHASKPAARRCSMCDMCGLAWTDCVRHSAIAVLLSASAWHLHVLLVLVVAQRQAWRVWLALGAVALAA